jgi:hypothetical protein
MAVTPAVVVAPTLVAPTMPIVGVVMGPRTVVPGVIVVVDADVVMGDRMMVRPVVSCMPGRVMRGMSVMPMSAMRVRSVSSVSMPTMSALGEGRVLVDAHQADHCRQSEQAQLFHD